MGVCMAVRPGLYIPSLPAAESDSFQIVCWPASIFCGCCATETGKKCVDRYPMALRDFADGDDRMLGAPADTSGQVNNAIPF